MKRIGLGLALAIAGVATSAAADGGLGNFDFGLWKELETRLTSFQLFGVLAPVKDSSPASIDAATAEAHPAALVTVATGLRARVVSATAQLGPNIDMMAPWPDAVHPTHLIACNEEGAPQPGLQRIRLSDGTVETILTGTISCDPVRATPWGTVIAGEENGATGWLLEIANPLGTTGVAFDRVAGTTSGGVGAENVVVRPALGRLAFEGIALYESGVMYYGDENRPGMGAAGGAYFKFVPSHPWTGGPPLTDLSQSPLADGQVYGLRLGKRSGSTDYGQGSNTGLGSWIAVTPSFDANLRAAAASLKLTGYYRPEDIDIDRAAEAAGQVRFCGNDTGNEGDDQNFGETVCITDGTLAESLANSATPELQYLVIGTPDFAMMDNIAYQPGRGNWLVQEDGDGPAVGRNNDIFACLDDGADADRLSDGCIRVLTINDLNAETTGGIFDAAGRRYWVSVQHNVTGHGVVLEVTGWR
jgi:secreted PhoX family phosphatase